jgi:proline iminopeptidase
MSIGLSPRCGQYKAMVPKEVAMTRALIAALAASMLSCAPAPVTAPAPNTPPANVYKIDEGYVDVGGVFIYYKSLGTGEPLVILHGGPGASHDYLLPHLIPLAKTNRLVFIDERGSGKSTKLDDPKGYTVENMADDVEAVRQALNLGKISLLGHSYGGVLAQAYALKYQDNLTHLILASTFHSTRQLNEVFRRMVAAMPAELRGRIETLEKAGLYGHGKDFEKNRYPAPYMTAAWGEGYFPYLYRRHPDANFDPAASGVMSWDLYREMWGVNGEFVVDGNLKSVEYAERLGSLTVPTLITAGDHDECDPTMAADMQRCIRGSRLVVIPDSGHMTFVDQPAVFLKTVEQFLGSRPAT